jgi:hypothetical protein
MSLADNEENWPELSYIEDRETFETLHLWSQIVGKTRLALTPWLNHSWHVPLYLGARGLTTSLIPHPSAGFEVEFDFIAGSLMLRTTAGSISSIPLQSGSVASFHADYLNMLKTSGVPTQIHGKPSEIDDAIPFAEDKAHRRYDPQAARRLWRALLSIDAVFKRFRTGFISKSSPVHFFWGSFDLALARYSGRLASKHPSSSPSLPDDVTRDAYSHEVYDAGFWPGGPDFPEPSFFSYAYPEPPGFRDGGDLPEGAHFDMGLEEYVFPYALVRKAVDPEQRLLEFLQATYDIAADAGKWDRKALECEIGKPRVVRNVQS